MKRSGARGWFSRMHARTAGKQQGKSAVWFDGNGVKGVSAQVLDVKTEEPLLKNNPYDREGYVFRGWNTKSDGSGIPFENQSLLKKGAVPSNLYAQWQPEWEKGRMRVEKVMTMEPTQKKSLFRSAQGFTMAVKDGRRYACCCFIRNTDLYALGDDTDYRSSIVLYDVESGERVAYRNNLMIDHANGMCYDAEKDRFILVTMGNARKPGYVYEFDWTLNVMEKTVPKRADHIGAIAWHKGLYYGLQPVGHGRYVVFTLDKDWNVLARTPVLGGFEAGYVSQGIAADDKYLYDIAADFTDDKWSKRQRLHIYTHDGTLVGMQTIPVSHEVEDIEFLDGAVYLNTNRTHSSDLLRVDPKSFRPGGPRKTGSPVRTE